MKEKATSYGRAPSAEVFRKEVLAAQDEGFDSLVFVLDRTWLDSGLPPYLPEWIRDGYLLTLGEETLTIVF